MLFLHFFVILINAYLSIKKSRVSGNMKRGKFPMVGTFWAVLPPVIAIGLALITKEVYSSMFAGIVAGGLLHSGFTFEGTLAHVVRDGSQDPHR